jgi:(S)-2-hydroxyglutarate dehydrogenase
MSDRYDFCVVGGGIVGLSTAFHLLTKFPGSSLVVLEKETAVAHHQTGHNSGVVHSGIYYTPGSRKADFCRRGVERTTELCRDAGITIENCGKLIVATTPLEHQRLGALLERATSNGVEAIRISARELVEREPHIRGLGAILVPSTGIVDYRAVSSTLADRIRALGGAVEFSAAVEQVTERSDEVVVVAGARRWSARQLVACGGLQADRLARTAGLQPEFRVVPFRGEYFRLPPTRRGLISHLIYPVPDPALPFLGVHLTRTVDGGITLGPNAVLGLAREGYRKGSVCWADVRDYVSYPGMWRFARSNVRTGARELRNSLFKRSYLAACRRYCPGLTIDDLMPEPAGIRAQVVDRRGSMIEDFVFLESERQLHVCNTPSPAATAALPIGEYVAERCGKPA